MANPMTLRSRAATGAVKVVNAVSRRLGRGAGTVAGGRVGLALDPQLLARLTHARTTIVVSGTNGKTTTTAFVAAGWGGPVATNATGANMPEGHVAALAASRAERVVLEVDEAWLAEVVRRTAPGVVILLNLSRDQLDRASEVRQMAERWRTCCADPTTTAVVVANANDPLVVYAAEVAASVKWCDVPTLWHGDATSCPKCTQPIIFDASGWRCECGFARPADLTTTLGDRLVVDGVVVELDLAVPGDFNAANAAQAVTALVVVGVSTVEAIARINTVSEIAGRFARRSWRGRTLYLVLAKNPAGFAAVLPLVCAGARDLWIAINDQVADGRDPSWLYDVPFEVLEGREVSCLGERRLDLATRLDYAGVTARVVDDRATLAHGAAPVWLVANYTAFSEWLAASTL
jgi:UDP-N-acetylmuramyl tripeptide synthase